MSLYLKYRPSDFNEVKGNRGSVVVLKNMLSDLSTCPHVFLFHGPTGCGKTTLARIVTKELGCTGNNIIEIDTAQFRGIDTVRDIRNKAQMIPLGGGKRTYIIDECFPKGTKILLKSGEYKMIENIKRGDCVQNLIGSGIVTNTFINKVDIDRVVMIKLSSGDKLFCSSDHLFYTDLGWIEAKNLKNNFVFLKKFSIFMPNNNKQNIYEREEALFELPKRIEKESEDLLLEGLPIRLHKKEYSNRNKKMSYLWEGNKVLLEQTRKVQQEVLQQRVCRKMECSKFEGKKKRFKSSYENKGRDFEIQSNREGRECSQRTFNKNEKEQSFICKEKCREGIRNKKNKWHSARMERRKRRQWETNKSTETFIIDTRMGHRSSSKDRTQSKGWIWLSYLLQSRYWQQQIEVSNRDRWKRSQLEKSKVERLEKGEEVERVRVESVTFYQRGSDDKYFSSIINNKERDQGFVNFYDFEVSNHHSYFADGILVHNCQKMTGDAQNAFLKILEDTPKDIYFILCTTDPNSLLPTIRNRCSKFQLDPLDDVDMEDLLLEVSKKEGELELDGEVLTQIIIDSQGSPRDALTILEQVLNAPKKRRLAVAQKSAEEQSQAIELCRSLMRGKGWGNVSKILSGLKGQDAEGVRRVVLGYASNTLLNNDNTVAGLILECFEDPLYNIGFPGLVLACYRVVKGD